jgi:hypothetical protein
VGTPRFLLLGRLIATPGALNAFAATGEDPINYIVRHMNLDPGVLAAEDQLANLQAVREGTRRVQETGSRRLSVARGLEVSGGSSGCMSDPAGTAKSGLATPMPRQSTTAHASPIPTGRLRMSNRAHIGNVVPHGRQVFLLPDWWLRLLHVDHVRLLDLWSM